MKELQLILRVDMSKGQGVVKRGLGLECWVRKQLGTMKDRITGLTDLSVEFEFDLDLSCQGGTK